MPLIIFKKKFNFFFVYFSTSFELLKSSFDSIKQKMNELDSNLREKNDELKQKFKSEMEVWIYLIVSCYESELT